MSLAACIYFPEVKVIPMMSSVITYVLGAFSPTSKSVSNQPSPRSTCLCLYLFHRGDYYAPLFVMLHANV
jgi:hypothetical protein